MAKGTMAIGYVHPESINAYFMNSLVQTLIADFKGEKRIKGRVIAIRSGPLVDRARNQIVQLFLEHPDQPDWLLMVDTDMTFGPHQVRKLFQAADAEEYPVVGGLTFAGTSGDLWPVMMVIDKDRQIQQVLSYPKDAMCKVSITGAAFLLIHRGVLEAMAEEYSDTLAPWFAFAYGQIKANSHDAPLGEDATFCLRAGKMGYPIHVHTGVDVGHLKSRVLNQAEYDRYLKEVKESSREEVTERYQAAILGANHGG